MTRLPELLCPAGDPLRLDAALRYGAHAVYLGGEGHSLRPASPGFDLASLAAAVVKAREYGARVYYCLNAIARETDLCELRERLGALAAMAPAQRPAALIVADPGVFRLARRYAPAIPIHLSTQANTASSEAVRFWTGLGAARINLARELTLVQVRRILRAVPDAACEIFVHGAMCLAVSGQCQLSTRLLGRNANRGECAHPCRYRYRVVGLALEEESRPGAVTWEVFEEQDGYAALLAAEDLCLAPVLAWLARSGVAALKIEGRAKSAGYVALTADVYRTALNDLAAGRFRPGLYLDELAGLGSRALSSGMFLPRRLRWREADAASARTVLGRVEEGGGGRFTVAVKARWDASLPVRLVLPGLSRPVLAPGGYRLENDMGERVGLAHPGVRLTLACDHPGLAPGFFIQSAPGPGSSSK
ncbi:MAG: U32 family peptidase [Desulfovibrionaceae bacterium]|nr:U32 family peptidase [Desulfovibrionaceae bacterium]MBF0514042.1 U32 family peptidase [Desulfovibrionaceae bacterium]